MGRKIELCKQIEHQMSLYHQFALQVQDLINKCSANWHEFIVDQYWNRGPVTQKFKDFYGDKIAEYLKKMDECLEAAEGHALQLEDRLHRQKTNLFKKYSENYKEAEKFLAKTKPELDTLHNVQGQVKQFLKSDKVPLVCKEYFGG